MTEELQPPVGCDLTLLTDGTPLEFDIPSEDEDAALRAYTEANTSTSDSTN